MYCLRKCESNQGTALFHLLSCRSHPDLLTEMHCKLGPCTEAATCGWPSVLCSQHLCTGGCHLTDPWRGSNACSSVQFPMYIGGPPSHSYSSDVRRVRTGTSHILAAFTRTTISIWSREQRTQQLMDRLDRQSGDWGILVSSAVKDFGSKLFNFHET